MNTRRISDNQICLPRGSQSKNTAAPKSHIDVAIGTNVKKKDAEPPATGIKKGAKVSEKRKIKYWKAPMNPAYIRDTPGKSPMVMELVPVYEGEEEGADKDPKE